MNTIKEQIVIMQESYNLKKWTKALIERCVKDNPNQSIAELSRLLGMSDTGLTHKARKEGINLSKRDRKFLSYALMEELEKIPTFKQK